MWRNTVLSSRLLYSSNPNPFSPARSISRPYLYSSTRITDPSSSTPYSFSPEPVEVGFNKSDAVQTLQFGAVDSSSLAAFSASKVRDVVDLARHYGRCYWELSKARLSMLVVATSGTGFVLGSGSTVDVPGLCFTCAGTMMVAASANSLNQVFEINNDAKMKRTKLRPLPSGRITVPHAITWASSIGVAGTALLACQANTLAAGLAATNLVLYAFIYTPLKQVHPVNTWVGAVVGAIPPLLGWAAASGQISLNAMILPAGLYFWQIPHFMALAYLCRDDYAAGGFRMFSLADASGQRTASVALRNCIYLIPLGFLAYDWGIASGWFCLESTLLTLAITATAFKFYKNRTKATARKMFHASLLYLPVFMSGILFHRLSTDEHCLGEEELNGIIERSFTSETAVLPENEYLGRDRVKQTANTRARPPVAFASVAPFPFLPAPCYDSY